MKYVSSIAMVAMALLDSRSHADEDEHDLPNFRAKVSGAFQPHIDPDGLIVMADLEKSVAPHLSWLAEFVYVPLSQYVSYEMGLGLRGYLSRNNHGLFGQIKQSLAFGLDAGPSPISIHIGYVKEWWVDIDASIGAGVKWWPLEGTFTPSSDIGFEVDLGISKDF